MSVIQYVIGDATQPQGVGAKIIVHVTNDIGAWGKGFVVALSRRFREPEREFRRWAAGELDQPYRLGAVQLVQVQPDLWVANLVGQHDIRRKQKPEALPPVRYAAIREGLRQVAQEAEQHHASIHMPRIGAGLAGGDWNIIEQIILEELKDLSVTVYDLA